MVKYEKIVRCFKLNLGGNRISATVIQTAMKCHVSLKGNVRQVGRNVMQSDSTT